MNIGMDHIAEDHVLDVFWLDSGSFDRLADNSSP